MGRGLPCYRPKKQAREKKIRGGSLHYLAEGEKKEMQEEETQKWEKEEEEGGGERANGKRKRDERRGYG